jgi:ABC-2 type transport system ATP-binding protein
MVRLFPGEEGEAAWTRAERLLLEQPRVKQVAREGDALRVRLEHENGASAGSWVDESAARLLAVLVGAGVPVCAFSHRERNLEDAFMHVTKGRVA